MNYKVFKGLSILTAFLLIVSCSLTTVGFITHKNRQNVPEKPIDNGNQTVENKNITYNYLRL